MALREFKGSAVPTTTTGSIASSGGGSVTIADTTGWPTGAGGKFAVVVDEGTASEEKILVTSRTGTTLAFAVDGRGHDDTVAVGHFTAATIRHCLTAADLAEANAHVNDTAVHLGTGTVASTHLATGAVTAGKIASGGVSAAAQLASDVVETAKILNAAVTTAKIADANVTGAKLATSAADASTLEVASGSMRVKDAGITQAKMASGLRVPVVCTSSTRPGSPSVGDLIYETNTGELFVYYGATTGWRPPWQMPWGVIDYATITADASFTTVTDIAGLSVTFTAVANRVIRLTAYCWRVGNATTADMEAQVLIREGGTTLASAHISEGNTIPNGGGGMAHVVALVQPSAGAHTYKVSAQRDSGSDTHTFGASATAPAFLLVEDLGASGTAPPAS